MAKNSIESGKTLFLPEFRQVEQRLEKQLGNPNLSFHERQAISNKLIALKLDWQQNGIGNLNVVIAMRDSILGTLKEAGAMGLDEATTQEIFGDQKAKLAELNQILAEGKAKGLI